MHIGLRFAFPMERIENGKLIWSINGTVVGGAGMVAG